MREKPLITKIDLLIHPFHSYVDWETRGARIGERQETKRLFWEEKMRLANTVWKRAINDASRDNSRVLVLGPPEAVLTILNREQLLSRIKGSKGVARFEPGIVAYARGMFRKSNRLFETVSFWGLEFLHQLKQRGSSWLVKWK